VKPSALHPLLALAGTLMVIGCDMSKPDMGDQPKANTYEKSDFFADGASARPLVADVVPRDDAQVPGMPDVKHRTMGAAGYEPPVPLDQPIPVEVTRELLERGQRAFNISCSVCHGRLGNGDGMIVQRGFSSPPSFHVQRLKDAPDAHFYNVITYGYGAMFSYNDRVSPEDRWAIVAYVRALQAAPDAEGTAVSAEDRAALLLAGDPNAPKRGAR
jgi:mono/diheme cytochrome c family protein